MKTSFNCQLGLGRVATFFKAFMDRLSYLGQTQLHRKVEMHAEMGFDNSALRMKVKRLERSTNKKQVLIALHSGGPGCCCCGC